MLKLALEFDDDEEGDGESDNGRISPSANPAEAQTLANVRAYYKSMANRVAEPLLSQAEARDLAQVRAYYKRAERERQAKA